MTGPGAPTSPGPDPAPGAPEEPAGASPAMVRAAKLNAANMVRSLLPVVLICVALVAWSTFRQSSVDPVTEVDPSSSVRISAERADYPVLAPSGLPDDYRPTSARTTASDAEDGEPVTLEIGWSTPAEEFAGFVISDDPEADPLRAVLDGAEEGEDVTIAGERWTRATTARGETALTRQAGEATVLVFGSAPDEELSRVAAAVRPVAG